jgi:MFS family permease
MLCDVHSGPSVKGDAVVSESPALGRTTGDSALLRTLVAAVVMDAGGIAAAGLAGALAVQITAGLKLPVTAIGLSVTAFFLTGGLVATLLGQEIDRLGWQRSILVGGVISSAALLAIALLVRREWQLVVALAAAGAGLPMTMPSTNVMLFRTMPADLRAAAISVKQAAVPGAFLLAGVSVPAIALTIGWRWAFALAAVVPFAGMGLVPRAARSAGHRQTGSRADSRSAQRRLWRVGLGGFLASLLPGALTAYTVTTLVAAGVSQSGAGLVLAAANVAGVVVRAASGLLAERRGIDPYWGAAGLMAVGGAGVALMAASEPGLVSLGALLAFGIGAAWPGLAYFLVVQAEENHPGAAGTVVQMGGMFGSGLGPAAFSLVLHHSGLAAGWVMISAATMAGGLVVAQAGHRRGKVRHVAGGSEPTPSSMSATVTAVERKEHP